MSQAGDEEFRYYLALYDFEGQSEAELSFKEGDVIAVWADDPSEEWWAGMLAEGDEGRSGLFPANRVEPYTQEKALPHAAAQYEARHIEQNPLGYDAASSLAPMPPAGGRGGGSSSAAPSPAPGAKSPSSAGANGGASVLHSSALHSAALAPSRSAAPSSHRAAPSKDKTTQLLSPEAPKTRIGLWATNMAILASPFCVLLGIGAIFWGAKDDNHGIQAVLVGLYSVFYGAAVAAYEIMYGHKRKATSIFPARGLAYFVSSFPLWFSVPTLFAAIFLFVVSVVNCVSAWLMEEYVHTFNKKQRFKSEQTEPRHYKGMTVVQRVLDYYTLRKQQNAIGGITFMLLYVVANLLTFFVALGIWVDKARDMDLSGWAPFAKAFGNCLDLNCVLLLVPVLRTIIRWLYNRSTANEQCFSKCLRAILEFVPLDKNISFHKIIAKVMAYQSVGHTVFHLLNYINAKQVTMDIFGVWPWISGGIIYVCMLLMYGAAFHNVKLAQFEIFWYSHHAFVPFFFFLLLHGRGGWNPNFWKWFLLPGSLYVVERLLRYYRAQQPVVLLSITTMKPSVISLEFEKVGVFAHSYAEGQYLFLCAPHISRIQWHPFTISSAPAEKTVTVHIKMMGEGSWTRELAKYLRAMCSQDVAFFELYRQSSAGRVRGKIMGPDNLPLLQIDGPHSAPTQHVPEYHTVMVAGAGIGVTPVAATLKSVVLHKWRFYIGHCFPDSAYFYWVCSHKDIDSFRWLVRAIKQCEDEVYDMRAKNPEDMAEKHIEIHVNITSVPKNQREEHFEVDDEINFWGKPREDSTVRKAAAPFTEMDLYKAMKNPQNHQQMGDVHIRRGRPVWDEYFGHVVDRHPNSDIGVCFCGNPYIAHDLKHQCRKWSSVPDKRIFKLHKENF